MSVLSRVRRTIREHDLAGPETGVLVAVSGGPDSVALADIVVELARAGELKLAGLAHFNHQLRDSAARDERFCRELAASLDVAIEIGRGDVARAAHDAHRSIEAAAHAARYAFLAEARRRRGADVVAVGHTRDDQAETFLLRLVRGAGARGLSGMHPRNGTIVRPLLECRRAELAAWLADRGLPYVVDETNADPAIPRNRIRAELLPLLERRFNPAIVDVLADSAEVARGEWLWMEAEADRALAEVSSAAAPGPIGGAIELDASRLAALPLGLQRMAIWRAISRLSPRPVAYARVREVSALLAPAGDGLELHLPDQTVKRVGARLVLRSSSGRARPVAETNLFEYSLSIPGEVLVPEAGGVVTAEEVSGGTAGAGRGTRRNGSVAVVRRDLCGSRLTVRNRRPGDRIRPIGLGGSRKLQDVFVDRKIGRAERDRIPVVVHENGRILWVAGHGIAEEFRVTDPAQPMLILRFKVVGGSV